MDKLRDIVVLITGCCASEIYEDIEALKNNGERKVTVVGVDIKNNCTTENVDIYYRVHNGDTIDFINDMLEICEHEKVDVVIPTVDCELVTLSFHSNDFKKIGTTIAVNDFYTTSILNNKLFLYEYVSKTHKDVVPKYYEVTSKHSFKNACNKLGYPYEKVVIKSTNGFGSRGIRVINDNKDYYEDFLNNKPTTLECPQKTFLSYFNGCNKNELMATEYLEGIEYSINVVAFKGNVIGYCTHTNNEVENSCPIESITGEVNEDALKLCIDIVKSTKASYNIGFDFIINEKVNLLECNPRVTATTPLDVKSGVNSIYAIVKIALGGKVDIDCNSTKRIRMKKIEKTIYEEVM